jgi:serine/threonine protein kinase
LIPGKIGRYDIVEEIGRGGMATVYRANDPHFRRQVALKLLPREFLHDPMFRARFEREAQTVAALEHMAIVPVYDFGEEDDQPYLVMRLMTGGSLAEKLKDGPLPLGEAISIVERVGSALDEAHARGIVHRDLKPGNILFDRNDDAFLTDFGIVKLVEASVSYTGSGIIGTPAYMSPEQAHGDREIDGRSDLYSLGIVLFEMLAGKPPYQADTPIRTAMRHILEPIPDIRTFRPNLPPELEPIITHILAKDPDDRYTSAADLSADLRDLERGELSPQPPFPRATSEAQSVPVVVPSTGLTGGVEEPQRSKPKPPLRKVLWIGAAVFCLAISAGIVFLANAVGPLFAAATATITPSPSSVPSPFSTSTVALPSTAVPLSR